MPVGSGTYIHIYLYTGVGFSMRIGIGREGGGSVRD